MTCGDIRIITYEDVTVYVAPIAPHEQRSARLAEKNAVSRLVEKAFGCDAVIMHKPSGRPYISGFHGDISVSHCRNYAALAVVDQGKVGVDIESARPQLRCVAPRFLNEAEHLVYGHDIDSLLRAWAMKEGIFKCSDKEGLTIGAINLLECDVKVATIDIDKNVVMAIARV